METTSLKEIKNELKIKSQQELLDFCVRLVKQKKENKELLVYLLFDSDDHGSFVIKVKKEIDDAFEQTKLLTNRYKFKALRKILKSITKYKGFTKKKETEIELLIHFVKRLLILEFQLDYHPVLESIRFRQIDKLLKLIPKVHEDLQFDYNKEMEEINTFIETD